METIITSASNPLIKRLKKLRSSASARSEGSTCIAEGIHLVDSFLQTGREPQLCAYALSARTNPEVQALLEKMPEANTRRVMVADDLFESIAGVHASVGILILFERPVPAAPTLPINQTSVVLEAVQDPGNLGTVLRTASAVGIRTVFLSPGCASAWSPKALRAGMGAQFSITIHEDVDIDSIVRTAAIPSLATSLTEESASLYSLDLRQPAIWIFGSEGQGVSNQMLKVASKTVTIPQVDSSVESLNIGIAAAVCLYEHYRQMAT